MHAYCPQAFIRIIGHMFVLGWLKRLFGSRMYPTILKISTTGCVALILLGNQSEELLLYMQKQILSIHFILPHLQKGAFDIFEIQQVKRQCSSYEMLRVFNIILLQYDCWIQKDRHSNMATTLYFSSVTLEKVQQEYCIILLVLSSAPLRKILIDNTAILRTFNYKDVSR